MEGAFVPSVFFFASSVSVDTNTDFASREIPKPLCEAAMINKRLQADYKMIIL